MKSSKIKGLPRQEKMSTAGRQEVRSGALSKRMFLLSVLEAAS